MSIWTQLASTWRTIARKGRLDAELDEELRAYADELADRKTRAGVDPEVARRAARLEMGGVEQVKERVRDERFGRAIDEALQDVRYACRGLRRSPLFTIVAVATLALGVGANTAIFSVVDAVLLRPAPVKDLDRLVMVWETDRQSGTTREPASVPDYLDFRASARQVEPLAGLAPVEVNLTPPHGDPTRLAALRVSRDLLPTLGFDTIAGRPFLAEEDRAGGPPVVIISDSLWQRLFDRDPRGIGRIVYLDERPVTVVGVVRDVSDFGVLQILAAAAYSRGFTDRGGRVRVDAWLPLQADPRSSRFQHGLFMLGRLAPGATAAAAQRECDQIAASLERTYADNRARGAHVEPLAPVVFGPVRPALVLLGVAVIFVLLVACVNVANMLLARGATRVREIAIRASLGAGAARLCRQFLVENLLLALLAGFAGIGVAHLTLATLVAMAPPDIPRLADVAIDARVLIVSLGISIAVGLVFGLLPTLQARRADVQAALKSGAGPGASRGREMRRSTRVLVVAQLALAVVLLTGAGLLIRSFWALAHVDAGFKSGGVLKAEYQLPASRYPASFADFPNLKEIHAFTEALLRRVSRLPGVVAVAVAGNHPLDAGFTNSFVIVGREAESSRFPEISVRRVTPGYFRTVGLPLMRGRLFAESDGTSAPPVLLINEQAARRFFPGRNPLGARIRFWGAAREIVGVVGDERFHGLPKEAPIAVYTPLAQTPSMNGANSLLVKTAGSPTAVAPMVRQAFRAQDPALAVFGIEPLDETVSHSLAERRFVMVLLGVFAAVAVALAAIGVHGVLAYGVAQRTREFGVRMALGARPRQVLFAVLGEAVALTGFAVGIGGCGALLTGRFLAGYLFGVAPGDWPTLAAVSIFLAAVALVAGAVPAWRATRVNPTLALRAE